MYGQPVSLTYKNSKQINSVAGGVATLLSRMIVIIYLLVQCKAVFDRNYTLQTTNLKYDISTSDA
jgi:hypothetical protein